MTQRMMTAEDKSAWNGHTLVGEPEHNPHSFESFTLSNLREKFPTLHPPVVDGLLRSGEIGNIISYSKVGKSWLGYSLALSIITGEPWLSRFDTARGRVLLVDNELHRPTIAHRIPVVGDAMGYRFDDYSEGLDILPLRGNLCGLAELGPFFTSFQRGEYRLIILDAKYRFAAAGVSENDNAAETLTYNLLDKFAEVTGAAIVVIHHTTKGSQSDKRITDVGAGAGAQSRAADAHLVLREHEDEGVVVLDAAVRSFAPVEPTALRWSFPLWIPEYAIDTQKLKGKLSHQEQRQGDRDKDAIDKIVKALLEGPGTARQLRPRTALSKERLQRLLDKLEFDGQVVVDEIEIRGNKCRNYRVNESPI